jgi:hypothetical protein
MSMRTIAAAAAVLIVAGAVNAEAARNATHPRTAPHPRHARAAASNPPPAEMGRLMAFRGVWQFDGTVTTGTDRPRKVRWRLGCKQGAGGWALVCDDTIHIPKSPLFLEHDTFGYVPATHEIHFFAINNYGDVRDIRGKWVNEKTIRYHYEGTRDGKPLVENTEVVLRDASTFDLTDTVTVGGKPDMAFHGTFHLQPKRARGGRRGATDESAPADEPAGQ